MFQKKREEKQRRRDAEAYGVVLNRITIDHFDNRGLLCLVRGLLVFLAVYGTLGAVVAAFGLSFHKGLVITALFLLALLAAFVYYNKFTFYTGYVFLFLLLIIMAFALYLYINSGFQALLNEIQTEYNAFFNLPGGR